MPHVTFPRKDVFSGKSLWIRSVAAQSDAKADEVGGSRISDAAPMLLWRLHSKANWNLDHLTVDENGAEALL